MECSECHKECTELVAVHTDVMDKHMCNECLNKMLYNNNWAVFKWEYYTNSHPDIVSCDACWTMIHREMYRAHHWYCLKCIVDRYGMDYNSFCPQCGVYHILWVCDWNITDWTILTDWRLSFTVRTDNSLSWNARWEATDNVSYIRSIWQFQTERQLPDDVANDLKSFYHWCKNFNHYYTREPITIKWTVKYNNMQALKNIMSELDKERRRLDTIVSNGWKLSRYHNYKLQWIDDTGLVKWKYVDTMWNIRERSESINKFFQEFKVEETKEQLAWEFNYVLSSSLEHKVKAFKLNEKVHSCQKSNNSDSYARWAYDAITNGCNCPILLYNPGSTEPFARITTRIMYDKEGQEYILIDRLYHSWQVSDAVMKWEVYKWIVKDLKEQWYKVIASNYSAHDSSTYSYLASLWMVSNTKVQDLCQPLRGIIGNCWYYCDWWTIVRKGTIDDVLRATDYLNEAYVL